MDLQRVQNVSPCFHTVPSVIPCGNGFPRRQVRTAFSPGPERKWKSGDGLKVKRRGRVADDHLVRIDGSPATRLARIPVAR